MWSQLRPCRTIGSGNHHRCSTGMTYRWIQAIIGMIAIALLATPIAARADLVSASATAETPLASTADTNESAAGSSEEIVAPDVVAVISPKGLQVIPLPHDGVVILYFYESERCPDCITIEATAQDLMEVDFEQAVFDSLLYWQAIDYEIPENSGFQLAYELDATSIVLSRRTKGVEVDWIVLTELWDLVEDTLSLADYIRFELEDFIYQTETQ